MKNVLIAGGGYGGVWAAMAAAATRKREGASDVKITLISDREHLSIKPRLYEGAAPDMLVPLGPLMAEIGVTFDVAKIAAAGASELSTSGGETLSFDRLVLATGSQAVLPNVPGADRFGFVVDTYDNARQLDAHLASLEPDDAADRQVVVIGARFTGLEIACALRSRFGASLEITLIDQNDRPGQGLGHEVETEIAVALDEANVTFIANETVAEVTAGSVTLSSGTRLASKTAIFATGFRASPLAQTLRLEAGPDGRIDVGPDLRTTQIPQIFAAGDVARAMADDRHATLMSCQHAMPMGVAAGRNAVFDLIGLPTQPYTQPDYATCIDLGPYGAVFTNGWDRKVVKTRHEAAQVKAYINTDLVYPPKPEMGQDAIFATVMGNWPPLPV